MAGYRGTLIPAYGRDYKSAKDAKADFFAGKDFVIANLFSGEDSRVCSINDCEPGATVQLRYKRLTQVCVVKVPR